MHKTLYEVIGVLPASAGLVQVMMPSVWLAAVPTTSPGSPGTVASLSVVKGALGRERGLAPTELTARTVQVYSVEGSRPVNPSMPVEQALPEQELAGE